MTRSKILLLDDREENLLSLQAILQREDITIYATTSPNEALKMVWQEEILVALVDVQMPGMDGFEFAKTLQNNPKTKDILIVFVTAISKETSYTVTGLKSGAVDYLYKPLDPHITVAKVDSLIRLAQIQSEIKQKNRRLSDFETIVLNSPDIIASLIPDTGVFLSVNPSIHTVLGHAPESIINTSILDLLVNPTNSPLKKLLEQKSYNLEEVVVIEDQFYTNLRQSFWLELRLIYKNTLLFVNIRDINLRKAHEREILLAQTSAEKARKAKESFLANMSHEIRTPLNGIIGLGNLLDSTLTESSQKSLLDMLLQSSYSLLNILNDILDISKIDEGKFSIIPTVTNLESVGNGILDLMRFKAEEKGIVLEFDYDANLPSSIMVDAMRLNQILLNLVGNALKFTTEGKVRVGIVLVEDWSARSKIRFFIEDTGIGISDENLSNIFSEYGQANDEISHHYGGTGLGLTISSKLVELMGGVLHVNSTFGKGSVFHFELILDTVETKASEEIKMVPFYQLLPFPNTKILVAEDNRINSMLLEKYLTAWGVTTTIAVNGLEVIEFMKTETYDMIVMDTRMPEMDGYQAARYVRQNLNNYIPILSLSATILPEDIKEALNSGMNDTLAKPFNPTQLHDKIGRLLKVF